MHDLTVPCAYLCGFKVYTMAYAAKNLNMVDLKDSIQNALLILKVVQKILFLIWNCISVKVVDKDPVCAHASGEHKHL